MSNLSQIWHNGWALLRARWYFRSAELGPRVRVFGNPKVVNYGTLRIGERVRMCSEPIRSELGVSEGATLAGADLSIVNVSFTSP